MSETVKVLARARPMNEREKNQGLADLIINFDLL